MKIISNSIEETIEVGSKLAKKLKSGAIVALIGQLGSGKTVLTKGIAKGLGLKDVRYVNSPSFVIIKEYKGRIPLYHFDLYRLDKPRPSSTSKSHSKEGRGKSHPLDSLGYDEYFYGEGVTVIEWADKIRGLLPSKYLEVKLSVVNENKRKIEIRKVP